MKILFLIMAALCLESNPAIAGGEDNFIFLDHLGKPLKDEDIENIKIANSAFPTGVTNIIKNKAGYYYAVAFNNSGHSNYATINVSNSKGKSAKISIGQYYWDDRDLSLRWVSENLLFMRIWWGRHWGSDYIYNADTCSIIYSDAFTDPKD